ncbi:hypothetical protein, variant 6 [Cryptococcus amylolentus CBS 6039]|uniref:BZIP domain-containing protein n=1 Tax=Cryptococcus amylolentus CBS 6039 TaxID=1295533 RepID=A0A1E3I6R6_9TREE|nr:hypothetical protein, variant 2 [Cryptococcus amylolentus CBS 6039]XP_018997527.1 hypothetical protein, variant 3 [Cryptococcus amylolentus CBS 6039]XP_018997528.1 hypothetical protein, variant 4 [Cryptococcus amylolentus CBS 6039]XP_018997529.1 hypothetical protein, variant 5 [Cryptococcus amylolentus CBS 6039]XP_018997530.1 hypothetical protein, variant 6 [Cryptococcus amylolentus CBS 6039]ODN83526.1 hypothetical protein, variant 2 [Cryptococcus amylolentus CBS 6039]ODN83527.1 hypothetic
MANSGASWPSHNSYGYYSQHPIRSTARHTASPANDSPTRSSPQASSSTHLPPPHQQQFPPPSSLPRNPASHNGKSGGGEMSFSQPMFGFQGGPPQNLTGLSPYGAITSNPHPQYPYPAPSPVSLEGGSRSLINNPYPHPEAAPRMPAYPTSPSYNNLSPVSPTTHIIPAMRGSASSPRQMYHGMPQTPATMAIGSKRLSMNSSSSENEDIRTGIRRGSSVDNLESTEEQPWGMPQEEYKALPPAAKKQVRNRIGARKFRAKRKGHVLALEASLRGREEEIAELRAQVDAQHIEIQELRSRCGLPPKRVAGSGLGLTTDPRSI